MGSFRDIINQSTIQHISHAIRNNKYAAANRIPFDRREELAYQNLVNNLLKYIDKKQLYEIEPIINEYTSEMNEIYFNTGIKYL